MRKKKVLIVNYFLMLGGGEKLLTELVQFCLDNNIQPEILITDNVRAGDNKKEEYYDGILKQKGVKIYRAPVFHKSIGSMFSFIRWRFRLKYSHIFYHSVHIINLNLADRLYDMISNKKRVFWHITNRIQFENAQYPYRQKLTENSGDTIVTINKFQLPELKEYFENITAKTIEFKLFLN